MQTKEEFFLDILRGLDADFNINKSSRNKLLLVEKNKKIDRVCFVKDDEIYMKYDEKIECLWCDYDKIWLVFEIKYSMDRKQAQWFIKHMVEKYFKLRRLSPLLVTILNRP